MIYLSRKYLCNFCPTEINEEKDGIVIFGSICFLGERGLKAKFGEIPTEQNVTKLGSLVTAVCNTCLKKKLTLPDTQDTCA